MIFEALKSIATHCSNTMSDTLTVFSIRDPDNVAPFLSQGDTLERVSESADTLTVETENGSPVAARASQFAPNVWRFGLGEETRAALVMFEEEL